MSEVGAVQVCQHLELPGCEDIVVEFEPTEMRSLQLKYWMNCRCAVQLKTVRLDLYELLPIM